MDPETPRPRFRLARRERGAWRSLARFVGLGALARLAVGTRRRATVSGSLVAAALIAIVLIAALAPGSGAGSISRLPGGSQRVAPGAQDSGATKAYPRLYSRKLGVDVAIKPGDGRTPPVQPIAYQYPRTAALGQPGNTYLYAHDRPGMFRGLHQAATGDVLIVFMSPTTVEYFKVVEIHPKVAWNDLQWLRPTQDLRLTLQTCNLSGDYDPRYVIVTSAIPVAQVPQADRA